jgi:hypothetical protein
MCACVRVWCGSGVSHDDGGRKTQDTQVLALEHERAMPEATCCAAGGVVVASSPHAMTFGTGSGQQQAAHAAHGVCSTVQYGL